MYQYKLFFGSTQNGTQYYIIK